MTTTISLDNVRTRIQGIVEEMAITHKERSQVVLGMWVAAIARQHLLMVGPGGTGKSFITRDFADRITGTQYFERALDETSVPDEILGPPDIKVMVNEGRTRRNVEHMLPEADYAFLDEFFNANGPTLHNIMPLLNERIHHNNGTPTDIPLRSCFMGTNKLNADKDMAALWDRVHHRHVVEYVADPENIREIVEATVERRKGVQQEKTVVTLEEVDAATAAALDTEVAEGAWTAFLDLIRTLRAEGISVSTRRIAECMVAAKATAWLNGHDTVQVADLAILEHMVWTSKDDIRKCQNIVLDIASPADKKALEFNDTLGTLLSDYREAQKLHEVKRNAQAIEIFKKCDRIITEASDLKKQHSDEHTPRLEAVIDLATKLKVRIGTECFGMSEGDAASKVSR